MRRTGTGRAWIVCGLVLVGLALVAAEAGARQWPNDKVYWCRYRLPDGTEDYANVTFKNLEGNNQLKRGRMVTDYPSQGWPSLDQAVTLAKPEDLPGPPWGPLFTNWELTLTSAPVIQCKTFLVWSNSTQLYFACENGVTQRCGQAGDPGVVRPPDIPGTP